MEAQLASKCIVLLKIKKLRKKTTSVSHRPIRSSEPYRVDYYLFWFKISIPIVTQWHTSNLDMPPAVGDIFWFVTSTAFVRISMTDCKRLNPPFNRRRLALGALPNSTSIRLGNGNINHWLIHFGAFHHASLKAMVRVALGWGGGDWQISDVSHEDSSSKNNGALHSLPRLLISSRLRQEKLDVKLLVFVALSISCKRNHTVLLCSINILKCRFFGLAVTRVLCQTERQRVRLR